VDSCLLFKQQAICASLEGSDLQLAGGVASQRVPRLEQQRYIAMWRVLHNTHYDLYAAFTALASKDNVPCDTGPSAQNSKPWLSRTKRQRLTLREKVSGNFNLSAPSLQFHVCQLEPGNEE